MIRPICPKCGVEVSYPVLVDGVVHCYDCARGFPQARVPQWLSRAKEQRRGLARDLTGAGAL